MRHTRRALGGAVGRGDGEAVLLLLPMGAAQAEGACITTATGHDQPDR